jgi:hypoxanthine phosphoribosyltransferase
VGENRCRGGPQEGGEIEKSIETMETSKKTATFPMRPLITQHQIQERVLELAEEIAKDNNAGRLHVVFVLKGAFIFCADLVRALAKYNIDIRLAYVIAKSYKGRMSTGDVELFVNVDIEGERVLLVEDIVDTGRTIKAIKDELRRMGPSGLRTVCLLDKPSRREIEINADYVGFEIEDKFVVGYGLDHNEEYRHLPYIAVID